MLPNRNECWCNIEWTISIFYVFTKTFSVFCVCVLFSVLLFVCSSSFSMCNFQWRVYSCVCVCVVMHNLRRKTFIEFMYSLHMIFICEKKIRFRWKNGEISTKFQKYVVCSVNAFGKLLWTSHSVAFFALTVFSLALCRIRSLSMRSSSVWKTQRVLCNLTTHSQKFACRKSHLHWMWIANCRLKWYCSVQ